MLYAGDDYVAVTTHPEPRVQSLYNTGKLEPHHLNSLLPEFLPLLSNAERLEVEKAVMYVQDHYPEQTTHGFPLRAVLVPKVCVGPRESRIVEATRASAFAALAPSTIFQLHTAGSEALSIMSQLVARVPCYGLELGSDISAIPRAIGSFLDELDERPSMSGLMVTLIVASLNGERFLRETLESAFAQDMDSYEVVFVDDGSTDGTAAIARSFPCATSIKRTPDCRARETPVWRSLGGNYLAFLDDDDLLPPEKLRVQSSYLEAHPETGCVLGRQEWIFEEGQEPANLQRDPIFGELGGIAMGTAMIRRSILAELGGFDPSYRYAEDRDLFVRLREHGVGIEVLPEIVLRRRMHGANMTLSPPEEPPAAALVEGETGPRARRGLAPEGSVMTTTPLISVMIGVYNAEQYLGEAIDSVFAQTYRPLEVIVVDDGSEDRSADVARGFGSTGRRRPTGQRRKRIGP